MISPESAMQLISEVRKKKAEYNQALNAFSNAALDLTVECAGKLLVQQLRDVG